MTYYRSDPLAGMHISVPNNGRVLPLTILTPEVNAPKCTVLDRAPRGEDLRVSRERGLKVGEKLQVLVEGMIRVEVRDCR